MEGTAMGLEIQGDIMIRNWPAPQTVENQNARTEAQKFRVKIGMVW